MSAGVSRKDKKVSETKELAQKAREVGFKFIRPKKNIKKERKFYQRMSKHTVILRKRLVCLQMQSFSCKYNLTKGKISLLKMRKPMRNIMQSEEQHL